MTTVGIIGCGLIGQKRSRALAGAKLIACADSVADRAENLAQSAGGISLTDWRRIIDMPAIDVVVVATTNDALSNITIAALESGKHVLVEKPAGRTSQEIAA